LLLRVVELLQQFPLILKFIHLQAQELLQLLVLVIQVDQTQ
jgi:hypothetical protein